MVKYPIPVRGGIIRRLILIVDQATLSSTLDLKGNIVQDTKLLENLRLRYNSGENLKFVHFWGHQPSIGRVTSTCLSQWYEASFKVDGQFYQTAEHFMMAEKASLFDDHSRRAEILGASNPGAAKALGRKVRGFDQNVWLEKRFSIVIRGNEAKFSQNPELGEFLKQTGSRILVEASPVDRIWGIGLAQDDPRVSNPNLWRGLNLLGFALMSVRDNS